MSMSVIGLEPSPVDQRISAAVKALISGQQRDVGATAAVIGISRSAMYDKLKGLRPFRASEVDALARLFGVRIEELFSGLGGRVGPRPDAMPMDDRRLPRLDSNQEPTGNWPPDFPSQRPSPIGLTLVGLSSGSSSARRLSVVRGAPRITPASTTDRAA